MAEKKVFYWTVVITYSHGEGSLIHRIKNCTLRKNENEPSLPSVQVLREILFSDGLLIPIDPQKYIIVSPWNIRSIEVERQDRYFNEP